MAILSMTGFSRAEGTAGACRWYWEVRSVNGRGLDAKVRVPAGLEAIEMKARDAIAKRFTRGNISASLNLRREGGEAQIRINDAALEQVIGAARRVAELVGNGAEVRPEGLLALKGVLEAVEHDETADERDALALRLMSTLETAIEGLVAARSEEGGRLAVAMVGLVDEIERLVGDIRSSARRGPEVLRARIEEQVRRLIESSSELDPQRLHQEAVVLATRGDIEEEIKRLDAHIASARDLLGRTEPVGRRFDFLAQEFNREANTICSKAFDGEISRLGLALKVAIDQLREQVQNIE